MCVMYGDGLIGNRAIVEVLGSMTAAVYNYMRDANRPAFKLQDVIGSGFYDYLYPPKQDKTEAVNDSLLGYMIQSKGFKKERFKGV